MMRSEMPATKQPSIEIGLASLKEPDDFTACTPIEAAPAPETPAEEG